MPLRSLRPRQRGISLIEALVAMAVMTFGSLAVLGVQATLRSNGDISKQRGEAVRIAQEAIESWRGYIALDGIGVGSTYYTSIVSRDATIEGTNASYAVAEVVTESADPRYKTLSVDVSWQDRADQTQRIQLNTTISGTSPAFAGTLAVPADRSVVRTPGGRNPAVPRQAIDMGDGTSRFIPPGGGAVRWTFDNKTGYITQACTASNVNDEVTCIDFAARLLAGLVRFATDPAQPTGQQSELPPSPKPADHIVQVEVDQTAPATEAGTVACFEDQLASSHVAYYCAVPVVEVGAWSGRSLVIGLPLGQPVEADQGAGAETLFRICRYTPHRDHRAAPTEMANAEHPLDYVAVTTSLVNQNFLVIRASNGMGTALDCPDDDPSTEFINGRTWRHQPSS